jgi:hypothetical protein
MPCVPIDIEVEVVTPDQMRKITFGLVKACHDNGTESWKINFELDEKQSATDADFKLVAKVSVAIGQQDAPAAKAITEKGSLSDAQTAQTIVAADTVKQQTLGQSTDEDVNDDVTQVLHADD